MTDLRAKLFVAAQRLLPKQLLTAVVYRLARLRTQRIKNMLIRNFVRLYKVDTAEVKLSVPDDFATFNDFFIRELAADARAIDSAADSIASPVDGTVSAAGSIDANRLFQAKGFTYTIEDLLATDIGLAQHYIAGEFATIYLAPYNYHRVHAPLAGHIRSMHYVPGQLFSVNRQTVMYLPELFVRNERLVCQFDTEYGPMMLVFVGALNVGSITTRWSGEIRPKKSGVVEAIALPRQADARAIDKGDTLGWFNMGSTVILLHPRHTSSGLSVLRTGQRVRCGEAIGRFAAS